MVTMNRVEELIAQLGYEGHTSYEAGDLDPYVELSYPLDNGSINISTAAAARVEDDHEDGIWYGGGSPNIHALMDIGYDEATVSYNGGQMTVERSLNTVDDVLKCFLIMARFTGDSQRELESQLSRNGF